MLLDEISTYLIDLGLLKEFTFYLKVVDTAEIKDIDPKGFNLKTCNLYDGIFNKIGQAIVRKRFEYCDPNGPHEVKVHFNGDYCNCYIFGEAGLWFFISFKEDTIHLGYHRKAKKGYYGFKDAAVDSDKQLKMLAVAQRDYKYRCKIVSALSVTTTLLASLTEDPLLCLIIFIITSGLSYLAIVPDRKSFIKLLVKSLAPVIKEDLADMNDLRHALNNTTDGSRMKKLDRMINDIRFKNHKLGTLYDHAKDIDRFTYRGLGDIDSKFNGVISGYNDGVSKQEIDYDFKADLLIAYKEL